MFQMSRHTNYVQQLFPKIRAQMTMQYSTCALRTGYLRLYTHTFSEYVTVIAFPQQQQLNEHMSMLHYTYTARFVKSCGDKKLQP